MICNQRPTASKRPVQYYHRHNLHDFHIFEPVGPEYDPAGQVIQTAAEDAPRGRSKRLAFQLQVKSVLHNYTMGHFTFIALLLRAVVTLYSQSHQFSAGLGLNGKTKHFCLVTIHDSRCSPAIWARATQHSAPCLRASAES